MANPITPSEIQDQLEAKLPGIEVKAFVDGAAVDIISRIPKGSPLFLRVGQSRPAVSGSLGELDWLKAEFTRQYFSRFTSESIPEEARKEVGVMEEISIMLEKVHPAMDQEVEFEVVSLEPKIEVIAHVKPGFEGEYTDLEQRFTGESIELLKGEMSDWWFGSKIHAEMLFPTKLKGVTVKTTNEIEKMLRDVGAAVEESPQEFLSRMIESGNRVLYNPYGTPLVEIIGPEEMRAKMLAIIERWNINPAGPSVMGQEPSFAEQYPKIGEGLVSFQFMLEDKDNLRTSGYDLEAIFSVMKDDLVIATRSTTVGPKVRVF